MGWSRGTALVPTSAISRIIGNRPTSGGGEAFPAEEVPWRRIQSIQDRRRRRETEAWGWTVNSAFISSSSGVPGGEELPGGDTLKSFNSNERLHTLLCNYLGAGMRVRHSGNMYSGVSV